MTTAESTHMTEDTWIAAPGGRRSLVHAIVALFVLTLRQHVHGMKLVLLSLAFLLPAGLAIVIKLMPHHPDLMTLEHILIFYLIPHTLAPLTALIFAAGIIHDEVEGQTLTYLLLRPVPKWALYLTRLAATIVVTAVIAGVFTLLAYCTLYWGAQDFGPVVGGRAIRIAAVFALAQAAYCALFGALSLLTRWAIVIGIGYIVVFEGILANLPIVIRQVSLMYYVRVLSLRWGGLTAPEEWQIDLAKAPTAVQCAWTLLGVAAASAFLASLLMRREFRMKTPGGA